MRRDWDCIRAILIALDTMAVPDFDAQTVSYQMRLLIDAGLIRDICTSITREGRELLDKIRSQTVWDQIKTMAREKGVSLSFEAINMLSTMILKRLR